MYVSRQQQLTARSFIGAAWTPFGKVAEWPIEKSRCAVTRWIGDLLTNERAAVEGRARELEVTQCAREPECKGSLITEARLKTTFAKCRIKQKKRR